MWIIWGINHIFQGGGWVWPGGPGAEPACPGEAGPLLPRPLAGADSWRQSVHPTHPLNQSQLALSSGLSCKIGFKLNKISPASLCHSDVFPAPDYGSVINWPPRSELRIQILTIYPKNFKEIAEENFLYIVFNDFYLFYNILFSRATQLSW